MWIKYYWREIINSKWLDVGVNDPLNNHTINVAYPLVELAPLDLIVDCAGTIALVLALVWFLVTFIRNFKAGYREPAKYAPPTAPIDPSVDYLARAERIKNIFFPDDKKTG